MKNYLTVAAAILTLSLPMAVSAATPEPMASGALLPSGAKDTSGTAGAMASKNKKSVKKTQMLPSGQTDHSGNASTMTKKTGPKMKQTLPSGEKDTSGAPSPAAH